ncbi:AraC family transcriptional regulator [Burkholderia sp. WSM2232]|uniref:AraC family transcriptional regulator n=1 Tax=Burkholderia sp. WSM2232 TaxID=944436 RepID=UPI000428ACB3|nr:AraC family transcriptional regulator [Burkholderia sp. WSM2232]
MEPLTELIALLRPEALDLKHFEARGDWALLFPADNHVVFGLFMSGSCRFEAQGFPSAQMEAGDFLLMPAPPSWMLSNGETTAPIEFQALRHPSDSRVSIGSGVDTTRIIGGQFSFVTANADLLNGLMSPVTHIRHAHTSASSLRGIVELIDREASCARPGRTFILNRLLEIMLVEALRSQSAVLDGQGTIKSGLLAGLADEKLAVALREFHADVGRQWTVALLAATAGMSRSAFADRFTRLVGTPPMDYVVNWRIALAKDALRFTRRPLVEIATATGYGSTSAFSTAFSRIVGCSPARYAERRRPPAGGERD